MPDIIPDFGLTEAASAGNIPVGSGGAVPVIAYIINIVLGIVGVVTLIFIIYGGFVWMTAGGNEEKVNEAQKMIRAAIVGLAIVLSAFIVTRFVVDNLKRVVTPNNNTAICKQTLEICNANDECCSKRCVVDLGEVKRCSSVGTTSPQCSTGNGKCIFDPSQCLLENDLGALDCPEGMICCAQ